MDGDLVVVTEGMTTESPVIIFTYKTRLEISIAAKRYFRGLSGSSTCNEGSANQTGRS
jgi:hypothetical protein